MMVNSDLVAAVAADRRRDLQDAAARYRLVRLARGPRPARPARQRRLLRLTRLAEDSGPAPSPAAVALHRPAAGCATTTAEQPAEHVSAA
jgi:hypothetical protein